jgi:hypothetical protein
LRNLKLTETKNIRNLHRSNSDFKQGYQPRTNIVKREKGDLVRVCHSILASWRNNFTQILNVNKIKNIRQREIYTAEILVPDPSVFDLETAIEKLKVTNHQVLIESQ